MHKDLLSAITAAILVIAFCITAHGRSVEHTVRRGETVEFLSGKYGVAADEILKSNNLDRIYVGLKLRIDIPDATSRASASEPESTSTDILSGSSNEEDILGQEVSMHFDRRNWGKAVKTLNKIVKRYPRAVHYYNRGLAHYNNGKYRQAANDLEKALSMKDCGSDLRKDGREILADARKRHAEWSAKQGQMWAGVITGVAAAGLSTWAAVETSKAQKKASSYTAPSTRGNTDINKVYNQLMAKTIQDVNRQNAYFNQVMDQLMAKTFIDVENEKQQVINEFRLQCQSFGYTPSEQECEQAYRDYLALRYGTTSSSGGDTEPKENKGNSTGSSKVFYVNGKKAMVCAGCNGDKRVLSSKGAPPNLGMTEVKKKCDECGQWYYPSLGHFHQNCSNCLGKGYIYLE